jgi:hypothetical protein
MVLRLDNCVRLDTADDCKTGKKMEAVHSISIKRQCLGSGVLGKGLGEVALLMAFLAKVSTKFNLGDCATEANVACIHRLPPVGKDEVV